MISTETLDRVLGLLRHVAEAHTTAAIAVEEIRAVLQEERDRSENYTPRSGAADAPPVARPVVDEATFTVQWNGRKCCLGNGLLLRLFVRLSRRPNQYVSHEDLLDAVWGDDRTIDTIRSAVRQLRARLRAAGMGDLAAALRGENHHYGLILNPS